MERFTLTRINLYHLLTANDVLVCCDGILPAKDGMSGLFRSRQTERNLSVQHFSHGSQVHFPAVCGDDSDKER